MECDSADRGRAIDVDTCALDGSGRLYLFHRLLSSVAVKRRKSWLLAASALASCRWAYRDRRWHSAASPPNAVCAPGPYPNGIAVAQPVGAITDLNVRFRAASMSQAPPPSANAVDIINNVSGTKTFVVMENGATINVTGSLTGLHVQQGFPPGRYAGATSDATVTAAGTINVQSNGLRQDAIGVFNTFDGAAAKVIYTGPSGGVVGGAFDLISSGASNGTIIQANTQNASGDAFVQASGNMLGFLNPGQPILSGVVRYGKWKRQCDRALR